jgi:hypothetical protein
MNAVVKQDPTGLTAMSPRGQEDRVLSRERLIDDEPRLAEHAAGDHCAGQSIRGFPTNVLRHGKLPAGLLRGCYQAQTIPDGHGQRLLNEHFEGGLQRL